MKRFLILIFILRAFSAILSGQPNNAIFRTGLINQIWRIEDIKHPISETTFPIEVIYPIQENFNIQVNHSPALSSFGDSSLSGISDTWIRSSYRFSDDRAMVSVGLGVPTGKTKLGFFESDVSAMLGLNAFKFQLPVFGQGFTISAGIMYALPINEKITVGGGANFVLRNKYKINIPQGNQLVSSEYNPGEQIGINLGCDYLIVPNLRTNFDFILGYYTTDKLMNSNDTTKFVSGPKYSFRGGLQYQVPIGYLWMMAFYRAKAKNETWDNQALVLVAEDKNTNITLRELEFGAIITLSKVFSLLPGIELRSYQENDYKKGQVDLYGGCLGYELQMLENLTLSMGAKFFFGQGEFMNSMRSLSGFELLVRTQWEFK